MIHPTAKCWHLFLNSEPIQGILDQLLPYPISLQCHQLCIDFRGRDLGWEGIIISYAAHDSLDLRSNERKYYEVS